MLHQPVLLCNCSVPSQLHALWNNYFIIVLFLSRMNYTMLSNIVKIKQFYYKTNCNMYLAESLFQTCSGSNPIHEFNQVGMVYSLLLSGTCIVKTPGGTLPVDSNYKVFY